LGERSSTPVSANYPVSSNEILEEIRRLLGLEYEEGPESRPIRQVRSMACSRVPPALADDFLTEAEAAFYLRVSRRSLQRWRYEGGGPAFYRLGPRRLAYKRKDLDNWATAGRAFSTSETTERGAR
jgi:hypothetical protein